MERRTIIIMLGAIAIFVGVKNLASLRKTKLPLPMPRPVVNVGDDLHGSGSKYHDADLAKHRSLLDSLREPALHLVPSRSRSRSRIGGRPVVPPDFIWPTWKDKPQSFLAQIDLAAVQPDARPEALPHAGILYFFYSADQDTWGFDPKDRGSWSVNFIEDLARSEERPFPIGVPDSARFTEIAVAPAPVQTYPDLQDDRIQALGLRDAEEEAYDTLRSAVFANHPAHHLFGYPSPIQGNDMDLECQLASHGIYCGDPSGTPRNCHGPSGEGASS